MMRAVGVVFLVVFVVGGVVQTVSRLRENMKAETDAGQPPAKVRRDVALLVGAVAFLVAALVAVRLAQ